EAPQVVARGERRWAEQIRAEARRHGVPILRNVPLARALVGLEVGATIPADLYEAVAEGLRFVYSLGQGARSVSAGRAAAGGPGTTATGGRATVEGAGPTTSAMNSVTPKTAGGAASSASAAPVSAVPGGAAAPLDPAGPSGAARPSFPVAPG